MSEYYASVKWYRNGDEPFIDNKYSRGHSWEFDGGTVVPASSSPHIVPLPFSVEANVDPEEAFVASLSSCHMLFFLSIAAKKQLVVESYIDNAFCVLEKDESGKLVISKAVLRPEVTFANDIEVSHEKLRKIHSLAHEKCFIANSVKTQVIVDFIIR